MPTEEQVFRLPVAAAARPILIAALVVGIGLAVGAYFGTLSANQLMLVIVLIAAVVIPLGILVTRTTFDVRVSAHGIKARSDEWSALLLPWSAITQVTKTYEGVGMPLVAMLLLETSDKNKSVLVPVAIAQQPEFRDAVAQHAGSGHPLVQALLSQLPHSAAHAE